MDTMTSSAFRRSYARLTVRTLVTANGRPLGVWTPASVTIPGGPEPERSYPAPKVLDAAPEVRPVSAVPKITGTTGIAAMTQRDRDKVLGRMSHRGG